jgi:hypothetical protein
MSGDDAAKKRALLGHASSYPLVTQIGWPWAVSDDEFVGASFHGVPPAAVVDTRVGDLSRRKHDVVCTGSFDAESSTISFSIPLQGLLGASVRHAAIEFIRLDGFDVRHVRKGFVSLKTGIAALGTWDEATRTCMRGVPLRTDLHARDCYSVPLADHGFSALVPPKHGFVPVQARQGVTAAIQADTSALGHVVFRAPHPTNSALHLLVATMRGDSDANIIERIKQRVAEAAAAKDCIMTPAIAADRERALQTPEWQLARCLALAAFLVANVPKSYLGDSKGTRVSDRADTDGVLVAAAEKAIARAFGISDDEYKKVSALRDDATLCAYRSALVAFENDLKTQTLESMPRTLHTGAHWLLEATTLLVTPATELSVRLVPSTGNLLGDMLRTQLAASNGQQMTLAFPARFTIITRDMSVA